MSTYLLQQHGAEGYEPEDAAEEMKRLGEIENARMEREKVNNPEDDDTSGAVVAM